MKISCSILNNISVISSKFINKFVQKCLCYYTFSDQRIPQVTVTSIVSLLAKQLRLVERSIKGQNFHCTSVQRCKYWEAGRNFDGLGFETMSFMNRPLVDVYDGFTSTFSLMNSINIGSSCFMPFTAQYILTMPSSLFDT